jgi:hypothetical protein
MAEQVEIYATHSARNNKTYVQHWLYADDKTDLYRVHNKMPKYHIFFPR